VADLLKRCACIQSFTAGFVAFGENGANNWNFDWGWGWENQIPTPWCSATRGGNERAYMRVSESMEGHLWQAK